MRFSVLVFVAAVVASPNPFAHPAAAETATVLGAAPVASSSSTPSNNGTGKGHRNRHHEHTPVFKKTCNCVKPIMPMGILSEKEVS